MAIPEQVCPDEIGQKLIRVTVADPDAPVRAHQPITLLIDYSKCDPAGVVLPLTIQVSSGASSPSYRREVFRRAPPPSFTFTPREGGKHLVRVGEVYHNRWWGSLSLDVAGARLQEGV